MSRYQQSPECPCGKNNKDGKYQPAEQGGVGMCHSCGKHFNYNEEEIIKNSNGQWRTTNDKVAELSPAGYVKPAHITNTNITNSYVSESIWLASMDKDLYQYNNFYLYLVELTKNPELVLSTLQLMNVGTIKNSFGIYCTIFWYIDARQRILNGKVFTYNLYTGKRDKVLQPYSYYKSTDTNKYSLDLYNITNRSKQDYERICIVESEKSAVLGSLACPQHLWLATGGKNFKTDYLHQLDGEVVLIMPDVGAEELWYNQFQVLDFDLNTIKNKPEGTDIGDLIIERFNKLNGVYVQDVPAGWYVKTTDTKTKKNVVVGPAPIPPVPCTPEVSAPASSLGFVYGYDLRDYIDYYLSTFGIN